MTTSSSEHVRRVAAVILFTDIENSTGLKENGFSRWYDALKRHNALFDRAISEVRNGRKVKHTGDGYLARFDLPDEAVRCALKFQLLLSKEPWDEDLVIRARCAIDWGTVADIEQADQMDVIGRTVDQTARIMSVASAGQVLVTRKIYDDAKDEVRAGAAFEDGKTVRWRGHGEWIFKGIDGAVEVYEAGLAGIPEPQPPIRSDKGYPRGDRPDPSVLDWRPAPGAAIPFRHGWSVEKCLGEGGLGQVWLCRNGTVRHAFKFFTDPRSEPALRIEADVQGRLKTRLNIRGLIEANAARLPYYIESEYAAGGDIAQWAERVGGMDKVPLEQRVRLVAAIAESVSAAHRIGVIHADIKPTNVLLDLADDTHGIVADEDGKTKYVPRVADFGTRRTLRQSGVQIPAAGDAGVPGPRRIDDAAYLAPEITDGRDELTTRSDVYALGVLLFQVVVGDFTRGLTPGWEKDVRDPLLLKDIRDCTARDPGKRPGASEVVTRLTDLAKRRCQIRRKRWVRRGVVVAVMSVLCLLVGIAYVATTAYVERERAATAAMQFMRELFDSLGKEADRSKVDRANLLAQVLERASVQLSKLQQYPQARAVVSESLGNAFRSLSQFDKAEAMYRQSLEAMDEGRNDSLSDRLPAQLGLINTLLDQSKAEKVNEADKLLDRLQAVPPDGPRRHATRADLLQARARLAVVNGASPANAADLFGQAAEELRLDAAGEAGGDAAAKMPLETKVKIYRVRIQQADRLYLAEKYEDALKTLDQATVSFDAAEYPDMKAVQADYHVVRGKCLRALDRHAEAVAELEAARESREAVFGAGNLQTIWAMHELATARESFESPEQLDKAITLREKIDAAMRADKEAPQALQAWCEAKLALARWTKDPEAFLPNCEKALAAMEAAQPNVRERSEEDKQIIQRLRDIVRNRKMPTTTAAVGPTP